MLPSKVEKKGGSGYRELKARGRGKKNLISLEGEIAEFNVNLQGEKRGKGARSFYFYYWRRKGKGGEAH